MARAAFIDDGVLRMALIGYEQEQAKIEAAIAEVRAQLGTASPRSTASNGAQAIRGERHMSAAARKRIGEATKRRWAAYRKEQGKPQPQTQKPKRKISAAGRARIIAATKKRWAAFRKEQKAAQKAAPATS